MIRKVSMVATILLAMAGAAQAATVTITGTADSSQYGYTAGNTYSFNFVLNNAFVNNIESYANGQWANTSWWMDRPASNEPPTTNIEPLFTSISGSGLSGTFTRSAAPFSMVTSSWYDPTYEHVVLSASDDMDGGNIGLNAGSLQIRQMLFRGNFFGIIPSIPATFINPGEYFSSMKVTGVDGSLGLYDNNSNAMTFSVSSASVTPEPATMSLLALGGVAMLKRRRNKPATY